MRQSTDDTDQVMSKYLSSDRVRWLSPLRSGCAAARNAGVSIARGRYIAFQDSDDEWLPEKLQKSVSALERADPGVGVVYTDMISLQPDGTLGGFGAPDVEFGVSTRYILVFE